MRSRRWLSFNPRARTGRDGFSARTPSSGPSFNPRARTGRDPALRHAGPTQKVSIHAPARGATASAFSVATWTLFQSTRPHGARLSLINLAIVYLLGFNPRARTGRDVLSKLRANTSVQFQSTRPHGARHGLSDAGLIVDEVSIHAPARGATVLATGQFTINEFQSTRPHGARLLLLVADALTLVSIHAPARGATLSAPAIDASSGFQSTRPHGARHVGNMVELQLLKVSIHAPARGATVNICRNITLRIASMQVIHHERLECAPVAQYTSKKMREPPGTTPSLGVRANTQCVK